MNTTNLVILLKQVINDKKRKIKEFTAHIDPKLSQKMDLLDKLRADYNEFVRIDFNEINSLLNLFNLSDKDKEKITKELDTIRVLLTLNEKEKTTYELSEEEKRTINLFLDNFEEYIEEQNKIKKVIDPKYNHDLMLLKQYKELLEKIINPKYNDLISDTRTIKSLLEENNLSEEEKQDIILALLKYNAQVLDKKEKENNVDKRKMAEKEIVSVLERFGYNFYLLDKYYQEELKEHALRKNIEEVLDTMQQLDFPKLDEGKEGLLLIAYLIATTKEILEEVTEMARERGINISILAKLASAFIPNNYLYRNKYKIGRKEDFKENLTTLSEHGISIPLVAKKEKELLISNSLSLKTNLEWLEKYGLYDNTQEDALLDDFLSALKAKNIPEIIDLWIENHKLGLTYIKQNLSALAMNLNKRSLLFYKLYISDKENRNDAFRITVSNGIKKLNLKREFTHDEIDYAGAKNMVISESIASLREFSKNGNIFNQIAAKNSINKPIDEDAIEYPEIRALNKFNDKNNTLLYDFDGIKISKLKVIRIYHSLCKEKRGHKLNSLLYAIEYQKIMSTDEREKIEQAVSLAIKWEEV